MGETTKYCDGSRAVAPKDAPVLAIQAHVSGLRYFWKRCPACGQEVETYDASDGLTFLPHASSGHPSWPRDKKKDRTAGVRS